MTGTGTDIWLRCRIFFPAVKEDRPDVGKSKLHIKKH